MASDNQRSKCCFDEWLKTQEKQLSELVEAQNRQENDGASNSSSSSSENIYAQLVDKSINSFQEYIDKRNRPSRQDVSGFFSPSWNSALENSMLWIAGCRPSIYIRLTYALCGSEVELHLPEIILMNNGLISRGKNLANISAIQLRKINELHLKTIKEEERLSNELASLQENIADQPIAIIAKTMSGVGESSSEIDRALDQHETSLANIMHEADKLRLSTLKELLGILTPAQGVDILAAGKKLHLCIHQWCKTRDQKH